MQEMGFENHLASNGIFTQFFVVVAFPYGHRQALEMSFRKRKKGKNIAFKTLRCRMEDI